MSGATVPPSPNGAPLLGNGLEFSRDPFGAMRRWADLGDLVRLDFPTQTQYMVTDPELIKAVLVENQEAFTIGQRQIETFEGIEDDAITATTGDRWRRLRKGLQPAFTWDGIRSYGERMAERTAQQVEGWETGQTFDLLTEMRLLTVRILGDTLLGIDMEGDEAVALEAADALVDWADFRRFGHLLPDWIPTPTDRRFDRAVGRLDRYIDEALGDHHGNGNDVCSVLFEAHERGELSWAEVHDNLTGLMLAGHDTTAVTLTFLWYELARRPDLRTEIVDETETVTAGDTPDGDDFDALELTRRVIRETFRLYPPTWAVGRQTLESVTLGGYDLPAGTQLMLPQWVLHRDGRFWDDPETFDPSRWERDIERPEYAYFPFSGGPRHCIGMRFARLELAMALATMVPRVSLDVDVSQDLTFVPSLSLRPGTDLTATIMEGG